MAAYGLVDALVTVEDRTVSFSLKKALPSRKRSLVRPTACLPVWPQYRPAVMCANQDLPLVENQTGRPITAEKLCGSGGVVVAEENLRQLVFRFLRLLKFKCAGTK